MSLNVAHPHKTDTFAELRRLGCSLDALELTEACEVIDLHVDTLIPFRLWGYDPLSRNRAPLAGRFFGHLDLPRMADAFLSGAMWSITTNPFRRRASRLSTFADNVNDLEKLVRRAEGRLALVKSLSEYREARARGAHALLLAIQGGNALEAIPNDEPLDPSGRLLRMTLVHLTHATFGASSSPFQLWSGPRTLNDLGRAIVARLNQERIFLDLAHAHPDTFWSALDVHNPLYPVLVTHTGVRGVRNHWRNIDDAQIKAVVASGGVVGIMAHKGYLVRRDGPRDGAMVVEHMEHVMAVGGENAVAFGSDFDGAITPPSDLCVGLYPMLTEHMLRRGWTESQIRGALGENFLSSLGRLRP